ncbi:MAG: putative MFS family arabinose efflux permease [Saprospiraceae bacterium]|jgi:predicted MFS family arabinose efflux permease
MKRNEILLILTLTAIQFTHILDVMIIMPLGKQFMEIFDISPAEFSFIVSIYAYSAAVSGFFSAFFLDRFDRKKAILILYFGFTISTFACAMAPDYLFLLAARTISGAFGGIMTAVILSIIGDVFPYEKRGQATGYVMMAFSVASVVGIPAGIYIAAKYDWRMTFIVVGAIASVFLIFTYYFLPPMTGHLSKGKAEKNPIKILRPIFTDNNQLSALLFSMTLIFGHFAIIPFIAPYMQFNIGFTDEEISYVYFVGGLFSVVCLPAVGNLADRFGKKRVFTIGTILAIGSIFWITNLQTEAIWVALMATSSYFVASGSRNVPATAIVTSVVKSETRGSFMSIRTSVNQFAIGASSQIAGIIIIENADGTLGNYPYVGLFAICMSLIALTMVYRLKIVS